MALTNWVISLCCMSALVVCCQAVCGITGPIWRNDNLTCPDRAVCGDVFNHRRNWHNGTTCRERRFINNCLCPGSTPCPFQSDAHMLHASPVHTQYTCNPVCTLPYCPNVQLSDNDQRAARRGGIISMTAEQRAPEFRFKTYYRMDCRCPRHMYPIEGSSSRRRTLKSGGYRMNWNTGRITPLYVCDNRWNNRGTQDSCPDSSSMHLQPEWP